MYAEVRIKLCPCSYCKLLLGFHNKTRFFASKSFKIKNNHSCSQDSNRLNKRFLKDFKYKQKAIQVT